VLGVKLKHLPKWTERRRAIAKIYGELLSETPLQIPHEAAWAQAPGTFTWCATRGATN